VAPRLKCDWCGVYLDDESAIKLLWPSRSLGAAFCRLEHVVPWIMTKNDWHIWDRVEVPEGAADSCAQSGVDLDEGAIYLSREREGIQIADGFAGPEELLAWAKAGGRYGRA
jgi:hypothetical protein